MPKQWTQSAPRASGFYEVRMNAEAWGMVPGTTLSSRLVYLDISLGRFDAVRFGGAINSPMWEWRGPVRVPASLPTDLG